MLLVQMKANTVSPAFISTGFLGEVVSRADGKIVLKDTCAIYELAQTNEQGGAILKLQFSASSQITNGNLVISEADILFQREVEPSDELLTSYHQSISAFRKEVSEIRARNGEAMAIEHTATN